jgi:hypothetical protein
MNPENLKPNTERTPRELLANTSKAGKASGEARRKKKLMSKLYGDFIASKFKIKDILTEKEKEFTGERYVLEVIKHVLGRGDAASVSMMKEIREATEGSRVSVDLLYGDLTQDEREKLLDDELKRRGM